MSIAPWMWAVWALVGFAMEMVALFDKTPNDTLTATIVQHFPGAWVLLALGILTAHFTEALKRKGQER